MRHLPAHGAFPTSRLITPMAFSGPFRGCSTRSRRVYGAYEVRNSVLVGLRRGRIARIHAERFLVSMSDLRVRLSDPLSYDRVFALADQHGLTVYDAAYLDLAVREGLPLASLDNDLLRAAERSGVVIFRP
jgi:predicted nucleic acid-binding protein